MVGVEERGQGVAHAVVEDGGGEVGAVDFGEGEGEGGVEFGLAGARVGGMDQVEAVDFAGDEGPVFGAEQVFADAAVELVGPMGGEEEEAVVEVGEGGFAHGSPRKMNWPASFQEPAGVVLL